MARKSLTPLAPGATIGILGGGQLGRMTAQAAQRLGYRVHIFAPDADGPAMQVTNRATVAPYEDLEALQAFARSVEVVTYEFENVPAETARHLSALVPLRPGPDVLAICQDRLKEKDFLAAIPVPTTRYGEVRSPAELARLLRDFGHPAVLKTTRFGYDGKGQVILGSGDDPAAAWDQLFGGAEEAVAILEGWVDFAMEISVVVARGMNGSLASYVPVENKHVNHILDQTIAPARIQVETADRAEIIARRIAEAIDLIGVMGVEMFLTQDGEILINELAPRPHNSGHWTMDACPVSQFEQFVRAVAGLPLGPSERHSDAVMKNLIGEEAARWREILAEPGARLHLYGKSEIRAGRKMGHVNRLQPLRSDT